MIFDQYPYTNFHEMNDDWIIKTLRQMGEQLDAFVSLNSLTYADPIEYNPDNTYPANTVVIYNTTAYVSKKAAPAGVLPTNDNYWLIIFPFGQLIETGISEGIDAMTRTIDAYIATANARLENAITAVPAEVDAWLAAHPEATTTVQPGSIAFWHLLNSLQNVILDGYSSNENAQTFDNTVFTQGNIYFQTGTEIASQSTCRTGFVTFPNSIIIFASLNNYLSEIYEYDSDGTYLHNFASANGPKNTAFSVKANHKYRVTVSTLDGSPMTPEDIPFGALMYKIYLSKYTTPEDIDAVKDLIATLYDAERYIASLAIYNGSIDVTTGENISNNARRKTDYFICDRKAFRIAISDDYYVAPFFYNKSGNVYTYLGYLPFETGANLFFKTNYNYNRVRFLFKRADNATMTSADNTAIQNSFNLLFDTDETLTRQYAAADAKAVGERIDELGRENRLSYGFEMGGVGKTTGAPADNTIRCRSMLIPIVENNVNNTLRFTCNLDTNNYVFKWITFYKDGVFVRTVETGYDPELSTYALDGTFNQFRISFGKPGDADFTQNEIDGFTLSTITNLSLSNIEQQENPFGGMKYVAFGDSITYGFIPRNYTGYPGQLASFAQLTAQRLGMSFANYGVSGSTMAYHADRNPMSRRFQNLPDDADLITVMGGTNDIRNGIQLGSMADRTDATYYGALHVVLGGLYKKYMIDQGTTIGKKKHIVVLTPIKLLDQSGGTEGGTGTLVDFESWIDAVKEVAAYYSMPCLDFYNLSGINPHLNETVHGTVSGYTGYYNPYITDGTHPTQEGAEIMADVLCGFLKTIM